LYSAGMWRPPQRAAVFPASGYVVWWRGLSSWPRLDTLSQTVVTWSYFPTQAHKHPDELSIHAWAGGVSWWTSVGYWPYTVAGRELAISWQGSNAPHLVSEEPQSVRKSRLLTFAETPNLALIDLERQRMDGFVVRRQVVEIRRGMWLIIDSFTDREARDVRTVWLSSPNVRIERQRADGGFWLRALPSGQRTNVFIVGEPLPRVKSVRGDRERLAGWVEADGRVLPAPALVVQQDSRDAWVANLTAVERPDDINIIAPPRMEQWINPENWRLVVQTQDGGLVVARMGKRLMVEGGQVGKSGSSLMLMPSPDIRSGVENIRAAFHDTATRYGAHWRDLIYYRWRVTYFLIGLFVIQEFAFIVYMLIWGKRWYIVRGLTIVGWVGIGIWLSVVYFQA